MTEQIVIKLNKKKFQPLLDKLIDIGGNVSSSYSESVGKSLLFLYEFFTTRNPSLDNKTNYEFLLSQTSSSHEITLLSFIRRYKEFVHS